MDRASRTLTLAVTSGKGGVGKSNIALNLAILLSAAGNRVALIDADLGLANLDVLVDVDARLNLSHVITGRKELKDILIDLPGGVQLVPGASGLSGLANLSKFQRAQLLGELTALEAENDIVIVDTAAGIGPEVIHFAASASQTLVVTTPEPTAITDAYAVTKVISRTRGHGQLSLLVNFARDRHDSRMTHQRIAGVARQFLAVRLLDAGYLPADPKVPEAVRRREPFVLAYPRCPASRCLAALARKLSAGGALVEQRQSFFGRVAEWFVG